MGSPGDLKAEDPGKKQLKQVLAVYNKAKGVQANDLARAEAEGRAGVSAIKSGYSAAKKNVGSLGLATKADIIKGGKKAQAATQQSEIARGFGGSNLSTNKGAAVQSETSSQLAKMDEQIAAMMATLNTGEAGALGSGQMSLAQLLSSSSGQKTDLASQIAQAIAGVQHSDPNAWMGSAATLGSAAILASDERFKRRFELVGETEGIPIWEFEYRSRFAKHFPGRYRGVRAQEVLHIPGAVHEMPNGLLFVDYSMLPEAAQFRKVA